MSGSVSKELRECGQLNDHEWNRSSYPISFDHKVLPERVNWHRQLNGKKLRLTLLEVVFHVLTKFNRLHVINLLSYLKDSPLVILQRDSNQIVTGYKGYCYEIIRALQHLYNFTWDNWLNIVWIQTKKIRSQVRIETSGGQYFRQRNAEWQLEWNDWNDYWSGQIFFLRIQSLSILLFYLTQEVDIGVGPFSVTHSRSKVVTFSTAFFADSAAILIPPPAEENRLLACTKPFHLEV